MDSTLEQLRTLRDRALAANGLSADSLQATIDGGSGWFTSEGKATIAKNLQTAGGRIDALAGRNKAWAEAGQTDAGNPYGWGDWKVLADALGSELAYDAGLAWDASLTGPLLSAVGQTAADVAGGVVAGAEALGNAQLSILRLFRSPWMWGAVGLGAAFLFFGPTLAPLVRRAVKAARA